MDVKILKYIIKNKISIGRIYIFVIFMCGITLISTDEIIKYFTLILTVTIALIIGVIFEEYDNLKSCFFKSPKLLLEIEHGKIISKIDEYEYLGIMKNELQNLKLLEKDYLNLLK